MGRTLKSFSFDEKKEQRENSKAKFKASETAERDFYRQLKKVARASGTIVEHHADGATIINDKAMIKALNDYAETIGPWATRQASKMLEAVNRNTKRKTANALKSRANVMAQALRSNVAEQEVGGVAARLLLEQVALIKSIPLEAGARAQRIAYDNFINGSRATPDQSVVDQLVNEMGMSTEVAVRRARLIARTETARANASFVQARSQAIGSLGYIWRTTVDGAERHSHLKMNGKYVEYKHPPTLSDGTTGHAGTFPNCRCYQDPVLPEETQRYVRGGRQR